MSSINTSFNSNFNFDYKNKKVGNVSSIATSTTPNKSYLTDFNKNFQTETLDMSVDKVDTKVSNGDTLGIDSYNDAVNKYKEYLKQQKDLYNEPLKYIDKELAALESRSMDYKQWVLKYKDKYDLNELREICSQYSPDDIKTRVTELKNEQANINAAIYKIEQQEKTAEYDYLDALDDYKNFDPNTSHNPDLDKIYPNDLIANIPIVYVNFEDYCEKNNIDYSKLDEYELAKKLKEAGWSTEQINNFIPEIKENGVGVLFEAGDEEAVKKYKYLFETKGKEEANKYLHAIKDSVNQQAGRKRADEFLATLKKDANGNYNTDDIINHLKTSGEGFGSGFVSFFEGLNNWFETDHVYSASEYEVMYIMEALKDSGAIDNVYELSQSVGNMVPSILIGMVATPVAGTTSMGVSAGGKSYHSAMVEGADTLDAIAYGVFSGMSEATLQYFLGKIPGLGEVKVDSLMTYIKAVGGEALEESVQAVIDATLREGILDEEIDLKQLKDDIIKSGAYGAIMGGLFNAPDLTISTAVKVKNGVYKSKASWFIDNFAEERGTNIDTDVSSVDNTVNTSDKLTNDVIQIIDKHNAKYSNTKDGLARLQAFCNPNHEHYGNYNIISSNDGARDILRQYSPEQIAAVLYDLEIKNLLSNRTSSSLEMHDFFENTGSSGNSQYGVDQAAINKLCTYWLDGHKYSYKQASDMVNEAREKGLKIPKFTKKANQEYVYLKNKLIKKGFTSDDASIILSSIDDWGACSYATLCNEIFYYFRNDSDLFEKLMGYPMYKVKNGKKVLNSTELLLDLYLYANDVKNGGKFFVNNKLNKKYLSTKVDVCGRQMLDTSHQVFMSGVEFRGKNYRAISSFLKSKSSSLVYDTSLVINNYDKIKYTEQEFSTIVSAIEKEINNGKSIYMGIYYNQKKNDKNIHMLSYNTSLYRNMETASWPEGFGHAVAVTGITSKGFVVSSWGKKYMIPFSDLRDGGKFIISSSGIKINN